jgi:hypothetical protein
VKYGRKIMSDEWVRIWKDACHGLAMLRRSTRNFNQDNRYPSRYNEMNCIPLGYFRVCSE